MAALPPTRDTSPAGAVACDGVMQEGAHGVEWVIDAHGCEPDALRDLTRLRGLFDRLINLLDLTPVADPVWHTFPSPGGVTGFVVLAESHLACHTFPEFGSICVNVFCCRRRADFDAVEFIHRELGATQTRVRRLERTYGRLDSEAI